MQSKEEAQKYPESDQIFRVHIWGSFYGVIICMFLHRYNSVLLLVSKWAVALLSMEKYSFLKLWEHPEWSIQHSFSFTHVECCTDRPQEKRTAF
jgi:hypothetical protein